jgi:flagellin
MEGFRINNNIDALTVNGNLRRSQNGLSKSIERLSSGLRINKGADDAAGLTVSEKLRGQIVGLSRGIQNSQDAVSLIQTAEGALNEDHSILNRMRELSVQAQSDALTSGDRLEIQKEVDQMVDEIDRISETTEFNTKKQLDGSMSALVSTDHNGLVAYTTGGAAAGGDYTVDINKTESGLRQTQNSAIQRDSTTGNVAGLSTKLGKLESMFDLAGNARLDAPETLVLKGNNQTTEVIMSSDQTLEQFTAKVESAITKTIDEGGLGMAGATFAFNGNSGQFIYEAGKDGSLGDLSLGGDEGILKALAMQVTVESEDAAFSISATQVGVATPTTVSETTTSARSSGVIGGMDLEFELASEARHDGSVAATDSITIANNDVVFTFHDTDGQHNGQAAGNVSAGVTITLTQSRTYTTASISTMINNAVAASNDPTNALTPVGSSTTSFKDPGITASFDGYNLKLTSATTGTSGEISIAGNQAAQDIMGVVDGKVTGSGGTTAALIGSVDISNGITINGTGTLRVRVGDGDFNTNVGNAAGARSIGIAAGGDISFNRGVAISSTSVVDTFNTYFTTNNIDAAASVAADGKLEIRSIETGTDAKLSIAGNTPATDSMANLGYTSGQTDLGEDGNAAVFTGNTADSQETQGFTLTDHMFFNVTDRNGATTTTIAFGTDNTSQTGESFTISKEAVTSVLNGSNLNTTDVDFAIDAGNRLDFFSKSAGEGSRVVLSTGNSSPQQTIANTSFGLDAESSAQGDGRTSFDLHVTDKTLNFEVGANQKQFQSFQVRNASSKSLGLTGVDVTNIAAATKALGKIDDAISSVSSERAKLGAVQNRLNSTINNTTVTHTNTSAFESSIRDIDIAKETVQFTRNQILTQAGTAQLAQSKALPQGGLQLLG